MTCSSTTILISMEDCQQMSFGPSSYRNNGEFFIPYDDLSFMPLPIILCLTSGWIEIWLIGNHFWERSPKRWRCWRMDFWRQWIRQTNGKRAVRFWWYRWVRYFFPISHHFTIFNLLTSRFASLFPKLLDFRLSCVIWNGNWENGNPSVVWKGGIRNLKRE